MKTAARRALFIIAPLLCFKLAIAAPGDLLLFGVGSSRTLPVFKETARLSTAGATTLTTVIQAHNAGDLLFAVVANGSTGTTLNTPSGWTKIYEANSGTTFDTALYYRVATGSDTNPTFTWTGSSHATEQIVRFVGTNSTGVGTNGGATTGTTNPHTSASFNSTAPTSLAVTFDYQSTSTAEATTPGGWTLASATGSGTALMSNAEWTKALGASGSASGAISVTEGAVVWAQIQVELLAGP